MSKLNQPSENLFDLSAVTAKLAANVRVMVATAIVFLVLGLGYTLVSPAKYEAKTTIYFPVRPSVASSLTGMPDADALGLVGVGPTSIKIFHRFLESETCLDYVSGHSGFERKKIENSRTITEDAGANMLIIAEVWTDGSLARQLLEDHLEGLSSINGKIDANYAVDDTAALRVELEREQVKLGVVEQNLVQFQRRSNSAPTTAPSDWAKKLLTAKVELASTRSQIQAASGLYRKSLGSAGLSPSDIPPVKAIRPKLVDAEYRLSILSRTYGPDAPEVRHVTDEIATLKSQLHKEVSAYVSSIQKGLIDPTASNSTLVEGMDVGGMIQKEVSLESQVEALSRLAKVAPSEQGTLADLTLKLSIQSDLVKQATLQFETAKLQSLRDPNKWVILDPPQTDPKPINKHYPQVAVTAILAGLLASMIWIVNFGRRPVSHEARSSV